MTSTEVRTKLVEALGLDLVGPANSHPFAFELLPLSPRRWYLTGFLVPKSAPEKEKKAGDEESEGDESGASADGDDASAADKVRENSLLPSSIGMSAMVPAGCTKLKVTARWGDYIMETQDGARQEAVEEEGKVDQAFEEDLAKSLAAVEVEQSGLAQPAEAEAQLRLPRGYRRDPREETIDLELLKESDRVEIPLPQGHGMKIVASWQRLNGLDEKQIPAGTSMLSVFLLNDRQAKDRVTYRDIAYQVELELLCDDGLFGRPDLRGSIFSEETESDEKIADLHYRDALEYAVGHGVSVVANPAADGKCHRAVTTFIPSEEVPRMDHVGSEVIGNVELSMEKLAAIRTPEEAKAKLGDLISAYRGWIDRQKEAITTEGLVGVQKETAEELIVNATYASQRMEEGIASLNGDVLKAFILANSSMARAARARFAIQEGKKPDEVDEPRWRVFQLAFILMNLKGLIDPTHLDRKTVDLLFFPTGGGKTEAYLGLAAFILVYRRLKNPGISSAGVSIIMRYTLRLLTLDQLGRAAALMCSLEIEREKDEALLGKWPFEIGLWVGSAATPNRMGRQGDTSPGKDKTAYQKLGRFKKDPERHPSPIPIEDCPWCGTKFEPNSFILEPPTAAQPKNLFVTCLNNHCDFSAARGKQLPILGVDEQIYRRLPCFIIATVDKFAALPWIGRVGGLFGKVAKHDKEGFYGACDPTTGTTLPGGSLPPPDLIIQDELHLISGPLGTVSAIYETVIEELCKRTTESGQQILPKIVASTATVRQAARQIRSLFGRDHTAIFPPPGPDRDDSFFAKTVRVSPENPGRLYLGVAAPGRSMKVSYLKSMLALLSGAEVLYGPRKDATADNPADPYMTLLSYFNSLRELGGSRRIVEDEVTSKLQIYWKRKRREPADNLFKMRWINRYPVELTSRVETDEIARARRALAIPFNQEGRVDVALATNMISVGLDIVRLGLMVVFGQPKTTSEYIQATSRVGRDRKKPGLVLTLLNPHKPRDRSHYERFSQYHKTFYRSVEATSVTPFSPRALDRALSAALVGLCRHMVQEMEPYAGSGSVEAHHASLAELIRIFSRRALIHDAALLGSDEAKELAAEVDDQAQALLSTWCKIAREQAQQQVPLHYQKYEEVSGSSVLLRDFLDPELETKTADYRKFRANRSMRDVETPVDIFETQSFHGTL
jgi:hypothetical protein